MAYKLLEEHGKEQEFFEIYVSETDSNDESDIDANDYEQDTTTWKTERQELLQLSHSILSPSFYLDARTSVPETTDEEDEDEDEEKNDISVISNDDSEIGSIFDDHEPEVNQSETEMSQSQLELNMKVVEENMEKYFKYIEKKEEELCRRLTVDETDVIYNSVFNENQ